MDTAKCEALIKSIDLGSFTAASKDMGYTPSGITRMIDALEGEIGFSLINRSRAGLTPTKAGELMLPTFRDLVRCSHQISQLSTNIADAVTGEITVGSYYSISSSWLPHLIAAFQNEHPGIAINLKEAGNATLRSWLSEGMIDCAFTCEGDFAGDFFFLQTDEMVAWVNPVSPLANRSSIPLSLLEGEPFIMPFPDQDNDIDSLLKHAGVHPRQSFAAHNGFTAWSMVSAGLGVSLNSALLSREWNGNVTTVPLEPRQTINLGIMVPSLASASPAAQAFVRFAQDMIPQS